MWGVIVHPRIREEKGVQGWRADRWKRSGMELTRLRVGRPSQKASGSFAWPTGPSVGFKTNHEFGLVLGESGAAVVAGFTYCVFVMPEVFVCCRKEVLMPFRFWGKAKTGGC